MPEASDAASALILPAAFLDAIVAQARAELPNECCGVVGGKDGVGLGIFPGRNSEASPSRYRVADEELVRILHEIDDRGWDVVAIYHSHVSSDAYPSPTDIELAAYSDAVYIIVSLKDAAQPAVGTFRIVERRVERVELRLQGA